MKTRFDYITDDEIEDAFPTFEPERQSRYDLGTIAQMAYAMQRFDAWLGWPVTFFEHEGMNYDGHHRVRAVKFLARRRGIQIHVPVRYQAIGQGP